MSASHPGHRQWHPRVGTHQGIRSLRQRFRGPDEHPVGEPGVGCVLMLLYIVKRLGVLFWVGCRVYPLDGPLLEFGKVACAAFDLAVDWL